MYYLYVVSVKGIRVTHLEGYFYKMRHPSLVWFLNEDALPSSLQHMEIAIRRFSAVGVESSY